MPPSPHSARVPLYWALRDVAREGTRAVFSFLLHTIMFDDRIAEVPNIGILTTCHHRFKRERPVDHAALVLMEPPVGWTPFQPNRPFFIPIFGPDAPARVELILLASQRWEAVRVALPASPHLAIATFLELLTMQGSLSDEFHRDLFTILNTKPPPP